LTAGTTRNDSSKFGPFKWVDTPLLAQYDDDTVDYGDVGSFRPFGHEEPTVQADYTNGAHETGGEDPETELSRNGARYTGRHATRKRVRRIVPVAAAAATLAAGAAAAYGLGLGGHAQTGNLSASMTLHRAVASTPVSAAGKANGAASAPIRIAMATASASARPSARHTAKATPAHTPTASAATSSPAAQSKPAPVEASAVGASAPVTATHAAAPAATTRVVAATTLSCNTSAGLLPQNVTPIVSFLLAHGYSDNAAAGIAGNIYQESKGDPESVGTGGGGLIGWTPLPAGFVTGNATADLQTQLSQILTYNQGWSQYLPALNSAASPAAAADIYVTDFERAGIPAASTRETSAQDVASACGI
jgi:hypothetical protein